MLKSLRDFAVVFVVVMAIGVFANWFAVGPGGSRPSPSPPVPPRPEPTPLPVVVVAPDFAARKAIADYAGTLTAVFNDVARQLEVGEITTADQLSKALSVTKSAKAELLTPVYQRMNAEYGKEKWDAQKAAKLLRALAAGMKDLE